MYTHLRMRIRWHRQNLLSVTITCKTIELQLIIQMKPKSHGKQGNGKTEQASVQTTRSARVSTYIIIIIQGMLALISLLPITDYMWK